MNTGDDGRSSVASLNDGRVRLLVSVRNEAEARAALAGRADVIDIKEPSHGPLGMASVEVIRDVVAAVAGRVPVSAALGELSDAPANIHSAVAALPPGLSFVKLGLAAAPLDWQPRLAARKSAHGSVGFIAAAYADAARAAAPPVEDVLHWAIAHNADGLLIDTFAKDNRRLFDHLPTPQLHDVITQAHAAGLIVALAGSITIDQLPATLALQPDLIAVRGAACAAGQRTGAVDADRVRQLADLIAAHNARQRRAASIAD